MKLIERIANFLVETIAFIVIAHLSLPRAINEHRLRQWKSDGQLVVYQYTPIIYSWPLITVGFYSLILDKYGLASPGFLGWTWSLTLVLVLFTFMFDVTRAGVFVAILVGALGLAVAGWLEARYGLRMTGYVWDILDWFQMDFSRGNVTVVTLFMGGVYLGLFLWRNVDSVITIQGDHLTVHRFASETLSYQSGGWALKAHYRDLLEWFLGGGAGTLSIVHPVTGKELFTANHVPGFRQIAAETRRRSATNAKRDAQVVAHDKAA